MIMDECPRKSNDYDLIKKSMDLSLYWAERSKKAFGSNPHKALYLELFKVVCLKILELNLYLN